MAASTDKRFVVNELLCYAKCKLGKLSLNTLKSVISDFYSSTDITTAKELLVDSVEELNIDKWPKPAKRKASDNKTRVEVDDIVGVFTFLDESLLLDKLPTFVAVNVDSIPSNRIEEGDVRCIMRKLDGMDKKLDTLPGKLHESIDSRSAPVLRATAPPSDINPRQGGAWGGQRGAGATSSCNLWSERVSSPRVMDRGASKPAAESDVDSDNHMNCDAQDAEGNFIEVRNKRKRVFSRQDADHSRPPASIPRRLTLARPKTVIGSSTTCTLKAAKELHKKRIFCVSNLSEATSSDEIKGYIESCNIKVFSVFQAKTKYADSTAFRVCIDASDVEKFASNDLWASHIIIREWVFKKPIIPTANA